MKTVFYLLTNLFLSAMILVSCDKHDNDPEPPPPSEPTLSVLPNKNIAFSATATESFEFTVTTDQSSWNAISSQTWCIVTKEDKKFKVTAKPNTLSTAPDAAVITVSAGKATPVTINVTQSGAGAELKVEPNDAISFTAEALESEVVKIKVETNQSSWDAVSNESWCIVTKETNEFTVSATPSSSAGTRNATVTVTAGNAASVIIEVTQAPTSKTILEVDKTELTFEAENGGEQSLLVTTNYALFMRSTPGWCHETNAIDNKNGTYTLKYKLDDNIEDEPRTGTIKIEAEGIIKNVSLTQAGYVPKESIGDYYYSDGSFSKDLNSAKTCLGVVVVPKTPKRTGLIVSHNEMTAVWGPRVSTNAKSSSDGAENLKTIQGQTNDLAGLYPGFHWCVTKGSGWYMPAMYELESIIKAKATINSKLLSIPGGMVIDDSTIAYWSSTEANNEIVWIAFEGVVGISWNKANKSIVRAVRVY